MPRIHNFAAGPASLPDPVRERLASLFAVPEDFAPSLLEISHRGPRFLDYAERLRSGLRRHLGIGDDHALLLMAGGSQLQFALLPLNLAVGRPAAYVESGHWSAMAIEQARPIAEVHVVGSGRASQFTEVPTISGVPVDAAFLHYCSNETVHGVQFASPPEAEVPVIADLSSELFSRPFPFASLGGLYACTQKNLGIPGLTIVALQRELLERVPAALPGMLSYRAWLAADSMPNTPSTPAWIVAVEMLDWLEREGGGAAMATRNAAKAATLYACIDRHDLYRAPVARSARSQMNAVFRLADPSREATFLREAAEAGLVGLEGHRAVGGVRVSLYNAVTQDAVDTLVQFMDHFATAG
jgi:phosphoserine aminotransferase